jgi:group I intron endonuclease
MLIDSLPHLSGIYLITCMANNRTYVGSSQNIYIRLRTHRNDLRKSKHGNTHLQNAWDKYGESNFVITVLELCVKSRLLECEAYWFKQYNVGNPAYSFNINPVPYSNAGHKASPEAKRNMSIAQKKRVDAKRPTFPKGNKLQLGRKLTPEHRRKLSEANKQPKSESMKQKLSDKYGWLFEVTNPEGETFVIKGLTRFCKENKLTRKYMRAVAQGKTLHHKGWKCRYVNPPISNS